MKYVRDRNGSAKIALEVVGVSFTYVLTVAMIMYGVAQAAGFVM